MYRTLALEEFQKVLIVILIAIVVSLVVMVVTHHVSTIRPNRLSQPDWSAKRANAETVTHVYQDRFFKDGHVPTIVKQVALVIIAWLCVVTPIMIVVSNYTAHVVMTVEVQYLSSLLGFVFAVVASFSVAMTIVQRRRRTKILSQYQTFDNALQNKKRETLERYMTANFGDVTTRQNVRYYEVAPHQNMTPQMTQDLFKENDCL